MKVVEKVWGKETWLVNDEYCGKILSLKPGYACSLHYHPVKRETFYVQFGSVTLERHLPDGIKLELLLPGDTRTIPAHTPHRFSSQTGAEIIEISTHHSDEDVVRIEESRRI